MATIVRRRSYKDEDISSGHRHLEEGKNIYRNFIEIIRNIENIKIKYEFNVDQAVIYYIIINDFTDDNLNIYRLHKECNDGIRISNFCINLSEEFNKKFMDLIKNEYSSEGYKIEFNAKKFEQIVIEILNKTGVKKTIILDENEKQNIRKIKMIEDDRFGSRW